MAMINVLLGEQTVSSHTITHHPFVIGRDAECDITIDNIGVSRNHCRILWAGGSFQVEDLKSSNGIQVNGESVQMGAVKDGDEITLGKYRLTFHQAEGEPPPPAKQDEPQSLKDLIKDAIEPDADKKEPSGDGMKTFQMNAALIRAEAEAMGPSTKGQRAGDLARSMGGEEKGSKKNLVKTLIIVNAVVVAALIIVLVLLFRK